MLHELIRTWFGWVEHWGYFGIFILMAMESSIIPVPSEVVMAPAAFWAAQGKMNFWLAIGAGTAGSLFGSALCFWVARWVGLPFLERYGKYLFLPKEKLLMGEVWVSRYGMVGIFVARLLPVVRHLISIPAGVLKMPFGRFCLATTIGAGLWCTVVAWFGRQVIGDHPELLNSPEEMVTTIKAHSQWWAAGAIVLIVLYSAVIIYKKRTRTPATVTPK